jgi:hypothetical protein
MEDKRVFLVGCILKGLAEKGGIYFGMAEDALVVADAALQQMADNPMTCAPSMGQSVHEERSQYG